MFSRFAVYFWMNWPAARVNVCFYISVCLECTLTLLIFLYSHSRREFLRNRNIWWRKNRRKRSRKKANPKSVLKVTFSEVGSCLFGKFSVKIASSRLVQPVGELRDLKKFSWLAWSVIKVVVRVMQYSKAMHHSINALRERRHNWIAFNKIIKIATPSQL